MMNTHLRQRIETLLNAHDSATLATCGSAGPQISIVTYTVQQLGLHLALPHGSDHLFNLETQPTLMLLTASWRLHGRGYATGDTNHHQATVVVTGKHLHVLNGQHTVETIDF